MKRGEAAFERLKEYALYKMNLPENVAKGWPSDGATDRDFLLYKIHKTTEELCDEAGELYAEIENHNYEAAKLEIADVAAYCAILLDLIEQAEKK